METGIEKKEDIRTLRTKRDLALALGELLQEKNYDDLAVKDITDKALVAKNTFYNNFSDKGELLSYFFQIKAEELLKELEPVLSECSHGSRGLFLGKVANSAIDFFYDSSLPLQKMIQADKSRSLFYVLTDFVSKFMKKVAAKYKKFFSRFERPDISNYFYSGGLVSILYFCFAEKKEETKEQAKIDISRLVRPAISLLF
ncbi:MAG: TetR/AcrR family transcriptional regulator [Bacilli bacterium]